MIDWRYKVKAWAVRDAAQPQAQRQQGPRNGKPPRQVFPDGTEINEQGELDVFKPPMENGREIQLPDPRRKKWNDKITAQCQ